MRRNCRAKTSMKKSTIKQHSDFLSLILRNCKNKKHVRHKLLNLANNGQICAILDYAELVFKNQKLGTSGKGNRFKTGERLLGKLKAPNITLRQKKNILTQSGGFLGALASLAPVAIKGFGSLLKYMVGANAINLKDMRDKMNHFKQTGLFGGLVKLK